jgi:hypothetical protein
MMQRGDLAPCCMMQRGVKLQSTKFFAKFEKKTLDMYQDPNWVLLMKRTVVENIALLSL